MDFVQNYVISFKYGSLEKVVTLKTFISTVWSEQVFIGDNLVHCISLRSTWRSIDQCNLYMKSMERKWFSLIISIFPSNFEYLRWVYMVKTHAEAIFLSYNLPVAKWRFKNKNQSWVRMYYLMSIVPGRHREGLSILQSDPRLLFF